MMIVGIDPGIVHTGAVRVILNRDTRTVYHEYTVIDGLDADTTEDWVMRFGISPDLTTIEKYVPRQKLNSDVRMVQAEKEFVSALPNSHALQNTGVRKLAPRWCLDIFGIGKNFPATHHQDLQAAARILYLGGVKSPTINKQMAEVVRAFMDGEAWTVVDINGWDDHAFN